MFNVVFLCCSGKKEALLDVVCVCALGGYVQCVGVVWCGVVRCCVVLCGVVCLVVCVCVAHTLKITVYIYI